MEQVFPDIYRFAIGKKRRSFSYLLVREQGNLLVCHANRGSSLVDHLDEVERLGGIALQLVTEGADTAKGELHGLLYERFGCPLACHEREAKKVRRKTDCPRVEFGEGGLQEGDDFRALDIGHTVFHWSHAGVHYLLPGHAIGLEDGEWDVHTHPFLDLRGPLKALLELPVDHLLPSTATLGESEWHSFTTSSRSAYRRVLRQHLRPPQKSLMDRLRLGEDVQPEELASNKVRLFSNYVSPHLGAVIDGLGLFDRHHMPCGATGKISVLVNSLALAEAFFFHDFKKEVSPQNPFWQQLRDHVEEGGTVFISDARQRVHPRWVAGNHPFPEIGVWGPPGDPPGNELTICGGHPAIGLAQGEASFHSSFYRGMSLEPGDAGSVLVRNELGRPVAVAGQVGAGRVVLGGFFYHPHQQPARDTELKLVEGIFRWLAGTAAARGSQE